MARRGFKIADAYVEIVSDRSALGAQIRDIPRELGADADRAGRELGDKLTSGLTRQVEQMSAKLVRARQGEKKATDAVTLAQTKLNEAEAKGVTEGSKHLALVQRLEQAQLKLRDAQASTVATSQRLTDTQNKLGEAIRKAAENAGADADRAGRDTGDKLAMGMRLAIIRNSPLIAAAIGAALVAGAPAVLGAASILFGGIAAVAAAQSDEVQSAWLGAWQQIKQGAVADAADVVPIFVGMADKVAGAFQRMRPLIREAFGDAAPQVDTLVDSLIRMAENALPGIVQAIGSADPVIAGIGSALENIGTGVGKFFAILSQHAPAAGEAFDALGRIIAALLPVLGELLGTGAELASVILPPLASILEVVANALSSIAPILPVVAAGFTAMKVAQSVTGMVSGLAASLGTYAAKGGIAAGVAGKLGTGIGAISKAAGPAAFAIGFVTTAITLWLEAGKQAEQMHLALGRALEVGGEQAAAATRAFDKMDNSLAGKLLNSLPDGIKNFKFLGTSLSDLVPSAENARDAYDDFYDSLDRLGQRQEDVKIKTDALKQAVDKHGEGSREAAKASGELAEANRALAEEEAKLEQATRGVTDAMLEQTDAALARADSDLAHRMAVDATEDAYRDLQKVLRETPKDTEAVEDASFALERAMLREVAAARTLAEDALPASMDANQRKAASDLAALDALHKLADQYGDKLPASIRQTIADLEASTAGYDRASIAAGGLVSALGDVGIAASAIPGEKSVRVEALTDDARKKLEDLGFKVVQMPDGSFKIVADSAEAQNNIGQIETKLAKLDGTTATPKAALDTSSFAGSANAAEARIAALHKQRPTPVANLNNIPLLGGLGTALTRLSFLNVQRPTPVSSLNNSPLTGAVGQALGQLGGLAAQRPTPVANLNSIPLVGGYLSSMARVGSLNAQRPTPISNLNVSPFASRASWLASYMGSINRWNANPWVTLHPNTGYAEAMLNYVARSRVSYITAITRYRPGSMTGVQAAGGGHVGSLLGRGFADGGSPSRRADGRIVGPGGPLDDLVPALTNLGEFIRVANEEWIIRGAVARKQGDWRMGLLNAGQADIVPRNAPPSRRFADGGTPVGADSPEVAASGRSIHVENLNLQVQGVMDLLTSKQDLRRLLVQIRDGLVDLEREDA